MNILGAENTASFLLTNFRVNKIDYYFFHGKKLFLLSYGYFNFKLKICTSKLV